MSAAPYAQTQRTLQPARGRQACAFRAGERVLDGSAHGVGLLLFYKYLVARCFADSSCALSTRDCALDNGVDPRTIRRYGPMLETLGLVRRAPLRRGVWRYTITAYAPELELVQEGTPAPAPVPEVVAIEPDPFFLSPPSGSIDPDKRIDRSVSSFNGSRDHQGEASGPGGDPGFVGEGFFSREEAGNAETIALLRAERVSPAMCRQLACLPPSYVREQIGAARRCGRGRDWPAFLVGVLRTGGVWGLSGSHPTVRHEPPGHNAPPAALPGICPACGGILPGEWQGNCPKCHPELFERVGDVP